MNHVERAEALALVANAKDTLNDLSVVIERAVPIISSVSNESIALLRLLEKNDSFLLTDVMEHVAKNRKIQAIKLLRDNTSANLLECKHMVEVIVMVYKLIFERINSFASMTIPF